jgi:hypothetical protein
MQNNDPKSENAAMKEHAAKDKQRQGREHKTVPHQGAPNAGHGAGKDSERRNARSEGSKEK